MNLTKGNKKYNMIIKFRITKDQLDYINQSRLPFVGQCGTADYLFNNEQYFAYMLKGIDDIGDSLFKDDYKLKNLPIIFYDNSLTNEVFNTFLEAIKKHKTSNIDIICLSVRLNNGGIESVTIHSGNKQNENVTCWTIVGEDFKFITNSTKKIDETQKRSIQAFGQGTMNILSSLSVGVVGASGTGSPMIEMLYRTGIGELVIIDPDIIEDKNLNRILNVGTQDAIDKKFKVDALKNAISNYGFSTNVEALSINVFTQKAVKALSRCDFIFGCTDTADSRALLNDISTFYSIPYIDVGVRLASSGDGNVRKVCYQINYVHPNGMTLESRKSISQDEIHSATLRRLNPEMYEQQVKEKYIIGGNEESPGVLCVNMAASSYAFLDFISRIHDIRSDGNDPFDNLQVDYTNMRFICGDITSSSIFNENLGKGNIIPLLNKSELS